MAEARIENIHPARRKFKWNYQTRSLLNSCPIFRQSVSFSTRAMNQLLITLCLVMAAAAIRPKDTKTTLEDIELDYTTLSKRTKLSPPPAPKTPAKSPTQYGFVPAKTAVDYAQKDPKPNYAATYQVGGARPGQTYQESPLGVQYQQVGGASQQVGVAPYHVGGTAQQVGVSAYQVGGPQYQVGVEQDTGRQQYNTIQYSGPTYTGPEQNAAVPQVYYVPQAQGQYENYENLQYVTDNSVGQAGQQYVYLQQYQAPSSAVQTVVDPTQGGVQYVMYLPSYSPSTSVNQPQTYENIISPSSTDQSAYLPTSSQKSQYYQPQYTQKDEPISQGKTQYTKANYLKREPKSLLDSYVPSSVQLQYYRAQQNAIQGGSGKTGSRFSYLPSYTS